MVKHDGNDELCCSQSTGLSRLSYTIDEIITILIEHAILSKTQSRYPYEEWFAEKGMFLLQNLRQIHIEHSGALFIKIKAPVDEYDGLYN